MNNIAQPAKDSNLIYDVGLYKGEDTDFYLKKGFKVIAFEAQPDLVKECSLRFNKEIASGQLTIVEGAIVEGHASKTVKFFRNKDISVWSTVMSDRAERNEVLGTHNEILEVPAIDFAECLRTYGIPHYLKIDIEGMDIVCIRALTGFDNKPDYISMESDKVSFDTLTGELDLFRKLGYTGFQAVNQVTIPYQKEPISSKEGKNTGYKFFEMNTGLFGDDLPGKWYNYDEILKKYKLIFFGYRMVGDEGKLRKHLPGRIIARILKIVSGKRIPGWYDTHAKHSSAK